jgi:hypothetical protein
MPAAGAAFRASARSGGSVPSRLPPLLGYDSRSRQDLDDKLARRSPVAHLGGHSG